MREKIIGIDLGTTNSEVAIVENGHVKVIPDPTGQKILPSVVGLASDGALLIGESARNQYVLYPERTVLSIKRKMGGTEKVLLGPIAYTPQEISALILKQLKKRAEAYLQCPIHKAVITVPAYFSDAQRQATQAAGKLAGLEVVRILNEPTAAALAYEAQNPASKRILVYDLGGGTFDVSVVSLQDQVVEVLASGGNNHLGGDDFDAKIEEFIHEHLRQQGVSMTGALQAQARIRRAAEQAKIRLSDHPFAPIEEEYLLADQGKQSKPVHLSLELSREYYHTLIRGYIEETLQCVSQVLQSAGLVPADIDEILLVGGSTKTPLIAERLEQIFQQPPRAAVDPELCVAMGAAIQAAMIAGEPCSAVLVDVTPYTFGISCVGVLEGVVHPHLYKPIIRKNTPLPVTKSEVFCTTFDFQEAVKISIYQGEHLEAEQNIKMGEFIVEGLRKVPAGNPLVVNFKLDLDGVLQVTTEEKETHLKKKITIQRAMSLLSETPERSAGQHRLQSWLEEMPPIIAIADQSPANGVDDAHLVNVNPHHQKVWDLIAAAEEALDTLSPTDQEDVVLLLEQIKEALHENQQSHLRALLEKLSDMLFYLDVAIP